MAELMQNPIISVIVPVYNVGKYIGQCLNTLTHQTISVPYEVIAVNDGSTDNSLCILEQYAAADSHVRVINQPNAGVSAARTAALKASRGEYLCFVDGDDYVAGNYLEQLYRACTINHADISCCYYYWHIVRNDVLFEYPFHCRGVYNTEDSLNMLLRDVLIQSFLWCKMYRREIFIKSGVRFPKMCFEDLAVLHQIFAQAKQVAIIDEPLYYYNLHGDSTLGSISPQKVTDYIRAIAMIRVALQKSGRFGVFRDSYHHLARKTRNNCYYYVAKMHLLNKDMRGYASDMLFVRRAISLCCKDDFSVAELERHLPRLSRNQRRRREGFAR